ncbi:sulfatase-like hydrolase/transferase [Candidatus Hydrogenedentota bacterium]
MKQITRREFIKRTGLGMASASIVHSPLLARQAKIGGASRPNILFVMTDQESVGFQGCYGNTLMKTHARDAIADEGIRFVNHYCASYPCSPSRATMITGRYAHNHGVVINNSVLEDSVPAMGGLFANAGYETAWIGKSHMGGCPMRNVEGKPFGGHFYFQHSADDGYDYKLVKGGVGEDGPVGGFKHWVGGMKDFQEYLQATDLPEKLKDPHYGDHNAAPSAGDDEHSYSMLGEEHHPAHFFADKTIEFLDEMKGADKPFCAVLSFYGPHHPICPPKPWDTMYSLDDIELPPNFMTTLDDKPLFRGTFSHLTPFKNFVRPSWSEDQFKDYIRRYCGYISYLDKQLERVLDALKKNGQEDNTIVLFTSDHGDMVGQFGIIYKRHPSGADTLMKVPLMIRWPAQIPGKQVNESLASNVDLLPTLLDLVGLPGDKGFDGRSMKQVVLGKEPVARDEIFTDAMNQGYMVRRGYWKFVLNAECSNTTQRRELDELYDLSIDPYEKVNLAYSPAYAERVAEMKERVYAWLKETRHPYADTIKKVAARSPAGPRGEAAPVATGLNFLDDHRFRVHYKWICTKKMPDMAGAEDVLTVARISDAEEVFRVSWFTQSGKTTVVEAIQPTNPAPEKWQSGKEYANSFEGKLPADLMPGKYAVSLGIKIPDKSFRLAMGNINVVDVAEITVKKEKGKNNLTSRIFSWERELALIARSPQCIADNPT